MNPPKKLTPLPAENARKLPADDIFNGTSDDELNTRATKPRLASISVPAQATNTNTNTGRVSSILAAQTAAMNIPNLPYEDSSSAPASLSPMPPQKIQARPPSASPTEREPQAMHIDVVTPTAPPPRPQPKQVVPTPAEEDIEVDTGSMSALLAKNKEYQNVLKSSHYGPKDPLDKYMKGELPKVYTAYPATPFFFVEPKTILEWDTFPANKLIALPFSLKARQQFRHNNICARLLAAVVKITKAQQVGVATPGPEDRMIQERCETPIAFLIHSLTRTQYQTLMHQKIWVSFNITFRVVSMKPTSPDYLFTLQDLGLVDMDAIRLMILSKWNEDHIQATLEEFAQAAQAKAGMPTNPDIPAFLETVWIKRFDVIKNDIIHPMFNVYAEGALIQDGEIWSDIRDELAKLTYEAAETGRANLVIAPYDCGICHGADHPRGLCVFPMLPEWKGPSSLGIAHPEPGTENCNRPPQRFFHC